MKITQSGSVVEQGLAFFIWHRCRCSSTGLQLLDSVHLISWCKSYGKQTLNAAGSRLVRPTEWWASRQFRLFGFRLCGMFSAWTLCSAVAKCVVKCFFSVAALCQAVPEMFSLPHITAISVHFSWLTFHIPV